MYTQASAPIDDRVADLLSQMTLDEKVAQTLLITFTMTQDVPGIVQQNFSSTGLGMIYSGTDGPIVGGPNCR